jgi:hypothetical protein
MKARKKPNLTRLFSLAILIAAGCAATSAAEGPPLSGAELQSLLAGNTFRGSMGAQPIRVYYQPDGSFIGLIGMGNDPGSGTWEVQGDQYCIQWKVFFDGVRRCYEWHKDGGEYELKNVDAYRTANMRGKIREGRHI